MAAADQAAVVMRTIGGGAQRRRGCARADRRHARRRRAERSRPSFRRCSRRSGRAAPRVGLVAGQRVGRKATGFKKFQSRIANGVRSAMLRDGTRDTGCGLKAFRRDLFLALPYFDGAAPLSAGAGSARGLRYRLCRRDRPAASARQIELWPVGPAMGRHSRSRRRVVAHPPQEARARSFGGRGNAD